MRIPRHILIRILIFGPLFLIFGTRAIITCQNRNEAARAQAEAEAERDALLKQHTRTITMPDGSTREYLELTPESAAQLGFPVPPEASAAPSPDAKADANVDAKVDANVDAGDGANADDEASASAASADERP